MPAGADPDEVPDLVESDDEDELEAADVRVRPHDEGSDEEAEPVTQDGWRWGVGEPAAGKGPAINPQGKIPGLNALKGKQRAMVPLTERSEAGRKWAAKRATRAQTAAGPSRR
eukprot:jgi/Mesvir1/9230/Mv13031-RA.1